MTLTFLWILLFHLAAGDLTIVSHDEEVTVAVGQRLVITCVSAEGHSIKWSYGGRVLSAEDAISTHTDENGQTISTLTLHQVSEANEGRYQCSNPDNYFDRDQISVKIQTSEPPQTVRIVEPDGDELRTVKDGKFTLKCEGEDDALIRWLHNGMPLNDMGSRVIITTSLDVEDQKLKSLLTRLSVTSQEEGRYSCQDENNPLSSDDVRVIVSETREDTIPVQMTQPSSSSLTVNLGSHFSLQCRGDSRASLTWYINNTLISLLNDQPGVSMTEDESSAKITVLTRTRAGYDHSGVYSCRNGLDPDDKDEVTVYVRHPDDVPDVEYSTPTEVRREILKVGSSMSLRCRLETSANYVTKWYKDDKRLHSEGKYLIRDIGAAELAIQDTDRQDAGVYRCTFLDKTTGAVIGNIIFNLTTIPCRPLTAPQNGSAHCPKDPLYGDLCSFTCQPGFRLSDMRPVQCDLEYGRGGYTWNRAIPKCIGSEYFEATRDLSNSAVVYNQHFSLIFLHFVIFVVFGDRRLVTYLNWLFDDGQ